MARQTLNPGRRPKGPGTNATARSDVYDRIEHNIGELYAGATNAPNLGNQGTYAQLVAAYPASSVAAGTTAWTTDVGSVVSNGASWIVTGEQPAEVTFEDNGFNGYNLKIEPISTTGKNAAAGFATFGRWDSVIESNANLDDPTVGFGYQFEKGGDLSGMRDNVSSGFLMPVNFLRPIDTITATASTTTTVLQCSAEAYATNVYKNWMLINDTRSAASYITANTATSITLATAIPGQASGDTCRLMRRETELFHAQSFYDASTSAYLSVRAWFYEVDRGSTMNAINAVSVTTATTFSYGTVEVTCAAPHGLGLDSIQIRPRFKLYGFTGGWSAINGINFTPTVIVSDTVFRFSCVSGGFGAAAGTITMQQLPVVYANYFQAGPSGLEIFMAPDNAGQGNADSIAKFTKGAHSLYGDNGNLDVQLNLYAGLNQYINGYSQNGTPPNFLKCVQIGMIYGGRLEILGYNTSGSDGQTLIDLSRTANVIGDTSLNQTMQFAGTGLITCGGALRLRNATVSGLPSASTSGAGTTAFVTDANATIIAGLGTTVAGGGANQVPVYSDGTNWIIG